MEVIMCEIPILQTILGGKKALAISQNISFSFYITILDTYKWYFIIFHFDQHSHLSQ